MPAYAEPPAQFPSRRCITLVGDTLTLEGDTSLEGEYTFGGLSSQKKTAFDLGYKHNYISLP